MLNSASRDDILIVDDTPDNLRLLSVILSQRGYEVRKALSGRMAITSAQAKAPDLILLDVRMPQMDGYQTCEQLKAHPQTAHIPIIFVSALDDVLDRVKAFALGGADYVTKPFHDLEVLTRIEHQLQIQRLHKQLGQYQDALVRSSRELGQLACAIDREHQTLQRILGTITLPPQAKEANPSENPSECNSSLEAIEALAQRMRQLIEDKRTSTRIHWEGASSRVDCNAIVQQAIDVLRNSEGSDGWKDLPPDRSVQIQAGHLPIVTGNAALLVQLFQALIRYTIGLARPEAQPQVRISASLAGQFCQFGVHDRVTNGKSADSARLPEAFQAELFQPHQSHDGEELAACRRIVEAHGGVLWVEAEPGKGNSFYFLLPVAQSN